MLKTRRKRLIKTSSISPKPRKPIPRKSRFHENSNPLKVYKQKRTAEQVESFALDCRERRLSAETDAERAFGELLRGLSIPFEREKIIYYNSGTRFILADFFIPDQTKRTEGIIVECDGSAHAGQLRYDAERDQYFKKVGYAVLRFTNKEVLKTPGAVRERLERELK